MKKIKASVFFLLLVQLVWAQADPAYPPSPVVAGNIVKAEYFIDTDPGPGNGINIPVTAAIDIVSVISTVNTSLLVVGTHRIYIRSLNIEGNWSITNIRSFIIDFDPGYSTAPAVAGNIVKAEYFIDSDPGFGSGINIPVTASTDIAGVVSGINTSSLGIGTHRLYIRSLSIEGRWSITNISNFIVDFDPVYTTAPPATGNVVKAEYFVDTDPGFGSGINIPVSAATDISGINTGINTLSLNVATHRVYIRTLSTEGKWSFTNINNFIVNEDPVYPTTPSTAPNISQAEYFIDTDPGFGNGVAIGIIPGPDLNNIPVNINTVSLTQGTHILYIRSKQNPWSITNLQSFDITGIVPLKLLSFSAKKENSKVELSWKTENEVNTSHFDIERSKNGINFSNIGNLTANNTSGNNNYFFTDIQPLPGLNFYRLKLVDRDRRFDYSPVARLLFEGYGKPINVYPNPAKNFIQIDFTGKQKKILLSVFDAEGKQVMYQSLANQGPLKINISTLSKGNYFIQVTDGEIMARGNFIKE